MHTYTIFQWSYMMYLSVVRVNGTLVTGSTLSYFSFHGRLNTSISLQRSSTVLSAEMECLSELLVSPYSPLVLDSV